MKLLSIIVPVYNTEKYLRQCLMSFVDENSELFSRIEVIIVNDGSTDGSLRIAKRFEKRYPEVFKVVNKKNGGHGSAINVGIKCATGMYFRVVDSDDWVDTNSFYNYLRMLTNIDVDLISTGYSSVDENTGCKKIYRQKVRGHKKEEIVNINSFLESNIVQLATTTYRTSILKNNKVKLDEHCYYVDMEYVTYPLKYVKTCVITNYNVYMYRINTSNQSCSNKGYFAHKGDHARVVIHLVKYISKVRKENLSLNIIKYYNKIIKALLIKQYKIYLMERPFSMLNSREAFIFDKAVKKIDVALYNLVNEEKFISELRKHKFKFFVLFKIKFWILYLKGKYSGLDF